MSTPLTTDIASPAASYSSANDVNNVFAVGSVDGSLTAADITAPTLHNARATEKLQSLWASLNAVGERLGKGVGMSTTTTSTSDEIAAIKTDVRAFLTAQQQQPTKSSTKKSSDTDSDVSDVEESITATSDNAKQGATSSSLTPAERLQLTDMLKLLEELTLMERAYTAAAAVKDGSNANDDNDEDARKTSQHSRAVDEARHKATVDAVMASMEAHLPSATIDVAEMDAQAAEMSLMLLRDEDIRQSFVDLEGKLKQWLAGNDTSAAAYTAEQMGTYKAQLAAASALVAYMTSDADALAVIGGGNTDDTSSMTAAELKVAKVFDGLMNALNALGEAPAGIYD